MTLQPRLCIFGEELLGISLHLAAPLGEQCLGQREMGKGGGSPPEEERDFLPSSSSGPKAL